MAKSYKNIDTESKFWFAWTDANKPNYGELHPNRNITSGQVNLEIFNTEVEMGERITLLTGIPYIVWESLHTEPEPEPEPEPPTSEVLNLIRSRMVVSPWQLRRALNQLGLRDYVEIAVAGADQDTIDGWAYATSFERTNTLVLTLAIGLGMSDEEMDNVFILAKTFNN